MSARFAPKSIVAGLIAIEGARPNLELSSSSLACFLAFRRSFLNFATGLPFDPMDNDEDDPVDDSLPPLLLLLLVVLLRLLCEELLPLPEELELPLPALLISLSDVVSRDEAILDRPEDIVLEDWLSSLPADNSLPSEAAVEKLEPELVLLDEDDEPSDDEPLLPVLPLSSLRESEPDSLKLEELNADKLLEEERLEPEFEDEGLRSAC